MLRAIIFDFDGTLADTIPALCEGINLTMKAYGYPEHTEDEVRTFINNGARELIRRAMPRDLQRDEALVDRVLADYDKLYGSVCLHTDRCYAGVRELVCRLHGMGLKIGVLSNKQDHYVKALCQNVLPEECCDAAQGMILGLPAKPDPFLSNRISEALSVDPSECILVGDSDVDVKTAHNAGMTHIGVSWGYRDEAFLRKNGAVLVAHTPEELETIILDIKRKGEPLC